MISLNDIEGLVCRPDASIRDVLARIDRATPYLFQVVVDQDDRIRGTITDGDIRRALLRGLGTDARADQVMNPAPRIGHAGDDQANAARLAAMRELEAFLPIVGDDECLKTILVKSKSTGLDCVALVMAGGRGRRLGETTKRTPKPLVEVGGKPILDHILTRLEVSGVAHIFVSVHYMADRFQAFLNTRANRAQITLLHESEELGTAGALANLPGEIAQPVLVINGDVMTDTDFTALEAFHRRHGYDGSIGVARHEVEIPYGVVRHGEDGSFAGIDEKPMLSEYVAAGIYYLGQEFRNLVPQARPLDMPALLNQGRGLGLKIGLFPIHEYWTDIGRPADLAAADEVARRRA